MASANKNESEFTSFDDVNLLETENASTSDGSRCIDRCADVPSESLCAQKSDDADQDLMQSKCDRPTGYMITLDETGLSEVRKDIEVEIAALLDEAATSGDGGQNSAVTVELLPTSSNHLTSLSLKVDSLEVNALPTCHLADDNGLDTSMAVLNLDPDVDSPQQQQANYEHQTSGDEIEVDIAALQRQICQLTSECDELKSLYTQTRYENDNYQEQILELNSQLKQNQVRWKAAHDKWVSQDNVIKNTIAHLTKLKDESQREKDGMVVKFAQAEQKNIELAEKLQKAELAAKDLNTEKENLVTYLQSLRTDKQKLKDLLEKRSAEMVQLKQDVERQKELDTAQELKTKWYLNQLSIETDAHKETRNQLTEAERQLDELKEDSERLRHALQASEKKYQESLVISFITKELELKETRQELETHRQEQSDQQQLYLLVKSELETLKMKEKDVFEELSTYKDKVKCLDEERLFQEQTLARFKETLHAQKVENQTLMERVSELEGVEVQLAELKRHLTEVQTTNVDMASEVAASSGRESHHLHCIQSLSAQTAKLQAENTELTGKVAELTREVEHLTEKCLHQAEKLGTLENELTDVRRSRQESVDRLSSQLSEQTSLAEERRRNIEDLHDEMKTLKRRHATSVKELTRQLQKRVEVGSSNGHQVSPSASATLVNVEGATNDAPLETNDSDCDVGGAEIQVDKRRLVMKIVQLQTSNASLTNKAEFLQGHVDQLMTELRNKTRIIQDYVVREDGYTLRPSASGAHSNKLTGMLSSVLQSGLSGLKPTSVGDEAGTTLLSHGDDSTENRLQAALEQTLLKNIQYKENAERVSEEMRQLSERNRQLKLQLDHMKLLYDKQ